METIYLVSLIILFPHITQLLPVLDSRSPVHRVPWWLLAWMKGSPLVFLVTAIVCFSTGVVLFTYSSGQV